MTFTGFVIASYTAERFCDCATIASMSCFDASASMSKVTFKIDADASRKEIEALVAQSQKRSAVYDVITNPTNVTVEVL